jgi:tetrahydromethanopterin S-methyltransferase subunit F
MSLSFSHDQIDDLLRKGDPEIAFGTNGNPIHGISVIFVISAVLVAILL